MNSLYDILKFINMLNFNLLSLLFIFTSFTTVFLSVYAYNRRNEHASFYLNLLLAAVSLWSFFYGVELAATSLKIIQICLIFEYLGIANVAVLWLLYAAFYTRKRNWLTTKLRFILFIIPIITFTALFSNYFHGMYYSSMRVVQVNGLNFNEFTPGVFYWIHIIYSFVLVGWGTLLFIRFLFEVTKNDKKRVLLIIVAGLIPYFVSIAYILGFKPYGYLDPTPLGFFIMALLLTYGALSNKLFEISPVALGVLFDSMDDSVIVVDSKWNLISTNPSAQRLQKELFDRDNINLIEYLRKNYSINQESTQTIAISRYHFKISLQNIGVVNQSDNARMIVISDITNSMVMQMNLTETEKKYQNLFENFSSGFALHELIVDENNNPSDYRFIEANKAFEVMTGFRREDIIGKMGKDVMPNNDFSRLATYFEVVKTGKSITFYNYNELLQKHYQITAYAHDKMKFATVFADITDRVNTEQNLINSEEKFKKVFATSPDCISIKRASDNTYILVNKSFLDTFGFVESDIIGKTSVDNNLWEDLSERQSWIDSMNQVGEVKDMTVRFLRSDGKLIHGLISSSIIEIEGAKHILSITKDVTDNVNTELELQYRIKLQDVLMDLSNGFINLPLIDIRSEIHNALKTLTLFVGADRSFVSFYELTGNKALINAYQWSNNNINKSLHPELAPSSELINYWIGIHRKGDAIVVSKPESAENELFKLWMEGQNLSGIIMVPLLMNDDCIGFLRLDIINNLNVFTEKEIKLLGIFAQMLVNVELREQSDVAFKNSQSFLKTIVQTIPDLIWVKDLFGKYQICNAQFESFFGAKEADIVGKTDYDFVSGDLADFFTENDKKAMLLGSPTMNEEWIIYASDGHKACLETIKTPIYNLKGEVTGVLGIGRDITDRKDVEENLRISEDKFRKFFEHSLVGKSITSLDGRLSVNKTFCEIVGYTEEELNDRHWSQITHPDDIELNNHYLSFILNKEQDSVQFEKRCIHKTGKIVWVDVKTTIIHKENHQPSFFITEINDITEQKNAEEALKASERKFRTLFSEMTEIVVLNCLEYNDKGEVCDYKILDCNNAFTKIIGFTNEYSVGKLASELYGKTPAPHLMEFANVCKTGKTYTFDSYYAELDKYFQISVVALNNENFATIITDLTELHKYNEKLIDKNKELEGYVYITSHDLRSPLINIQGFSSRLKSQTQTIYELIKGVELNEEKQLALDKLYQKSIPSTFDYIFNSVSKMESLLNSLLQISRMGRTQMNIVSVDMNLLINKVMGDVNYQLQEIEANVIQEELPNCYGDEVLLNQLFANIITNAIKYRDSKKKLQLTIKAEKYAGKNVYCISDNGIGISDYHLEKIWNVFYRVDNKSIPGDGIGLSISKRIVDRHTGRIWLESEVGVGTKFYIELPNHFFQDILV